MPLAQSFDRINRLWTQPSARPNLALPNEAVGVDVAQPGHDGGDAGSDFGGVGIAAVDDRHGERVGREEEDDRRAEVRWVFEEGGFDVAGDGL